MEDIVPDLLKNIQDSFADEVNESNVILKIQELIAGKKATYKEAYIYAEEIGKLLSNAYGKYLSTAVLPDGKMYYNIASRILQATLGKGFTEVADVTEKIQTSLNMQAGLGIKAVRPDLNQNKIDGIVNRISSEDNFDNISWILKAPVENFMLSTVDDSIKRNADFHYKAGLTPKIVRKEEFRCCKWCSSLGGAYAYPDVPKDVYRRHENCRCTVDYYPGNGKRQNLHTKAWQDETKSGKMAKRILAGTNKKTAGMTAKEYADYQKELQAVKNSEQILLPKKEYALVMSEINTNMSDEDRKHGVVTKAIGNYKYTFINKGFNDYTIIDKQLIDNVYNMRFEEDKS